jgi:hypothetical protein
VYFNSDTHIFNHKGHPTNIALFTHPTNSQHAAPWQHKTQKAAAVCIATAFHHHVITQFPAHLASHPIHPSIHDMSLQHKPPRFYRENPTLFCMGSVLLFISTSHN